MDERDVWSHIDALEARLRSVESSVAVLMNARLAEQIRSNYLPGWVIAILGVLVSTVSVLTSFWFARGGP